MQGLRARSAETSRHIRDFAFPFGTERAQRGRIVHQCHRILGLPITRSVDQEELIDE